MDDEMRDWIKAEADADHITPSDIVRQILARAKRNRGRKKVAK